MIVFKNKFLVKLIAMVCLILTVTMSCANTNIVWAADDEETEEEVWGGALLSPIVRLVVGLGDAIVDILHQNVLKQDVSLIKIDGSDFWMKFGKLVLALIAVIVVIAVAVTGVGALVEAGVLAAATAAHIIAASVVIAGATGVVVSEKIEAEWIPNDVYLPIYRISAQEIFANQIPLFDINFFNPMANRQVIEYVGSLNSKQFDKLGEAGHISSQAHNANDLKQMVDSIPQLKTIIDIANNNLSQDGMPQIDYSYDGAMDWKIYKFVKIYAYNSDGMTTEGWDVPESGVDLETYPNGYKREETEVYISKADETVFYILKYICTQNYEGKPPGNAKFTEEVELRDYQETYSKVLHSITESSEIKEKVTELISTASQLTGVVSQWYFTLRNLALLVLMLLLIYSGIRIVIGSTAGEKAKHKERIMDWLTAVCLIFIMHYIMVFAVELNEKIVELINTSVDPGYIIKNVGLGDSGSAKYQNAVGMEELQGHIVQEPTDINENGKTDYYVVWETDLMGGIRINAQESKEGTATWVGSSICFIILVAFTLFFAWTYLKRLVYMTFLTMVAPLVAMTYPLDKITDGKAQAFNTWLKEYIFNLLIQPMHLLLYTILISSAYELASVNIIYSIVAMGFMIPAEKLIRRFFGFEKAQTPGALGGAAGAALAMTGMQSVMRWGQNHGGNGKEDKESGESSKIKYSSSDGVSPTKTYAEDYADGEYEETDQQAEAQQVRTVSAPVSASDTATGGEWGETSYTNYIDGSSGDYSSTSSYEYPADAYTSTPVFQNTPEQLQINAEMQAKKKEEERKRREAERQEAEKRKSEEELKRKQEIERSRKGRVGRTIKGVSAAYTRELGNKALKRFENGHPVRSLARGMLGLAGGATFGMLGLALGVASGDPSKAFQYTSTGALGGYQAGKGLAGSAVNALSVSSQKMGDEFELSWYDVDEYKKEMFAKQKKEILEDESYITYVRKMTGKSRKEAIDLLNDTGDWCLNSGVRDVDDMVAIDKIRKEIVVEQEALMEKQNKIMTEEQRTEIDKYAIKHAISMKKSSDRLPTDIHKMGAKKIEEHRKQFQREIEVQLQKDIKDELVSRIRMKSEKEISEELMRELQESGEHVSAERFKQLTEERIGQLADKQISQRAKDASEEMIAGIVRFSETKSSIGEA